MIEFILISFLITMLLWKSMSKPHNFPPGPFVWPIIGNLPVFNYKVIQSTWDVLENKYGSLVGLVVPKFKVVVVSGYSATMEMVSNEALQGRPDVCLARDRFNGENYGIIFLDGEKHKIQKRFSIHHFRNLGFGRKSHESVIIEEVMSLCEEVEKRCGKPFSLEHMFGISSINILWYVVGGKRFDRNDPKLIDLAQHVKELAHKVQITGSIAVVLPLLRYIFPESTGYKAIKTSCKRIIDFIKETIKERENDLAGSDKQTSFIDIYLEKMKESAVQTNSSFSMEQLEGLCMDFLAAGSDTSSGVLGFAFLFLCLFPERQEKIYEEILTHIGLDRVPTYQDKTKLVYTDAFLTEVLRFRHPLPTFPPRRATEDTILGGYNLPKGTILIPNAKSIFMDEDHWEDPQIFRPERFVTEDRLLRRDERLLLFGKGKRSCLGETLAKTSNFLMLVTLVQRFSFCFPDGEVPHSTEGLPGFTLGPPHYKVIVTPRASKILKLPVENEQTNRSF